MYNTFNQAFRHACANDLIVLFTDGKFDVFPLGHPVTRAGERAENEVAGSARMPPESEHSRYTCGCTNRDQRRLCAATLKDLLRTELC